jgi:hypothetical protein
LFVPEELGLEQRFGNGGAVDGHEGLAVDARMMMDAAREQLLSRACLAANQDGGAAASGDLDCEMHGVNEHRTRADQPEAREQR